MCGSDVGRGFYSVWACAGAMSVGVFIFIFEKKAWNYVYESQRYYVNEIWTKTASGARLNWLAISTLFVRKRLCKPDSRL